MTHLTEKMAQRLSENEPDISLADLVAVLSKLRPARL
jgi:hypothetical protein